MKKRRALRPGEQSQLAVFYEIWAERPHVSEVSGLPLVDPPEDRTDEAGMKAWLSQFSHLLPKGAYRKYKKDKGNIILKTAGEHALWEKHKGRVTAHCDPRWVHGWTRITNLYVSLYREANLRK